MDAVLKNGTVKDCKDWFALLPLTNTQQAHSTLLAQLKLLIPSTLAAADRLQILEILREPVAFVRGERAKRYSGLAMQDHNRIYRAPLKPEDVPRKIPASLIMAPTAYQSNRPVDLYIDTQQSAKLPSLLDKGVNFERATFVAG